VPRSAARRAPRRRRRSPRSSRAGRTCSARRAPGAGASVAVANGRAYFGTFENEVLAVDLAGKKVAWRYAPKDRQFPFYSSAAIAGGKVILGGRDKVVHAIDAASGKAVWTFATRGQVDSSPVIVAARPGSPQGDKVVVGSEDGRLYIVNLADGKESWTYEIGAAITGSPAVAGGLIVIGADDGGVYCFGEKK